jgi:hypothetical protein
MTANQNIGDDIGGDETLATAELTRYDDATTAIADAVAEATNSTQTDLKPLQKTIDADALNKLVEGSGANHLAISFSYEGVNVSVTNTTVEVWR